VLEQLINIRNRLTALKKLTANEYVKPSEVLAIYHAALQQVTRLNAIREQQPSVEQDDKTPTEGDPSTSELAVPGEPNRLDTTLSDIFHLLSLFFLTIGKAKEAPATFCQLATMNRLLSHMNESGVYTVCFPFRSTT